VIGWGFDFRMPPHAPEDRDPGVITQHLRQWRAGDPHALDRLTEAIYAELRRLASGVLSRQQSPQTLQPTELLHEFYLELQSASGIDAEGREQFLGLAAKTMRNVLVDHARKRITAKRGGGALMLPLENAGGHAPVALDVLQVHDALERFGERYPRQAKVVELRFFGGLTADETAVAVRAEGMECSLRTIERDWRFARAWLQRDLTV
jgi:RNA polymerase sigma-70 factor (ECF subfamily)